MRSSSVIEVQYGGFEDSVAMEISRKVKRWEGWWS